MIKSPGQALPPGLKPQKRLGQNFLWQKGLLNKMVAAADLNGQDLVLEIGPGLGSLTQALAKKAKRVIAVEKDPRLIPILRANLREFNNIEIIEGDVLKIGIWKLIENCKLKIKDYKVVSNLPYYIATAVIRQFLEAENPPELMVLMLQKEVAQRIAARPPKMSLLAVSIQFYADVKIIGYVSRKSFWPKPKVDGAIIKITPHQLPKTSDRLFFVRGQSREKKQFRERFFRIVKAGFSQPRKQSLNNLSQGLNLSREEVAVWLNQNKISPQRRPSEIVLENWLALTASAADDLFS